MKILKWFIKIVFGMVGLLLMIAWLLMFRSRPMYNGTVQANGIGQEVDVYFDEFAIPHIYAQSEKDAFWALGFVHASERLFQMEMIRRVASGRLSEVFGKDFLKTDRLFRTLGTLQHAKSSAQIWLNSPDNQNKEAAEAYQKGINHFISTESLQPEFLLLNHQPEPFKFHDIYLVTAYMAFGFAEGLRTDPLVEKIYRSLGTAYLNDLELGWPEDGATLPNVPVKNEDESKDTLQLESISQLVDEIIENLPIPLIDGSNSWVIGQSHARNGKVILCNDTHMAYAQPSVWYEAHLNYPGFEFYGHFLAGFPFAPVGHTREAAVGITMLQNDDVDFYYEKLDSSGRAFWMKDHWEKLAHRQEIIQVKNAPADTFHVEITRHGPIIDSSLVEHLELPEGLKVSVWWAFLRYPSQLVEAAYEMMRSTSPQKMGEAVAKIGAPGLNIMYGDKEGNIGYWAAAKLIARDSLVQTKRFLNGFEGRHEALSWHDFESNTQVVNPASDFVYSANNQPESVNESFVPQGYYVADHRAERIIQRLLEDSLWDVSSSKVLITDSYSGDALEQAEMLLQYLPKSLFNEEAIYQHARAQLLDWSGDHELETVGATIYHSWIANLLKMTFEDELGKELYLSLVRTHLMRRTIPKIVRNQTSVWWDNVKTDEREDYGTIVAASFRKSISELRQKLGDDVNDWYWSKVHHVTHSHPLGKIKPLNWMFNVSKAAINGGYEVINNTGFKYATSTDFPAYFGPALRTIVDFSDVENSVGIIPTGQSGHFMSPHYNDQSEKYNEGGFRKMRMNKEEIKRTKIGHLKFKPSDKN